MKKQKLSLKYLNFRIDALKEIIIDYCLPDSQEDYIKCDLCGKRKHINEIHEALGESDNFICKECHRVSLIDKRTTELQLKNTIYQLFIGKVSEIIGIEKTKELLKESREAFNK